MGQGSFGSCLACCLEHSGQGIPWWSNGYDLALPSLGSWVQSLVRELSGMGEKTTHTENILLLH